MARFTPTPFRKEKPNRSKMKHWLHYISPGIVDRYILQVFLSNLNIKDKGNPGKHVCIQ